MTDLQAAILEVQLRRLDEQHRRRNANLALLEDGLRSVRGVELLRADQRITTQAAYQYVVRYREQVVGAPRSAFVAALRAEGVPCDGLFYEALPSSGLLSRDRARYPRWSERAQAPCPVAERAAYAEAVWFPHYLFLGGEAEVGDVVEAIVKVTIHAAELRGLEHPAIDEQERARTRR
jgi:dTDP-4-amino-4,6-dideoxygalactose transaminase